MNRDDFERILQTGENVSIEFKRGGNGFEDDAYQTVCSFLNRFGGDLFLGVLNDGTVTGVPENAALDMKRNFIKRISNPNSFSPTVYLEPRIFEYEGKTVIHVHIPQSAEVHSFKRDIYDRNDDADIKVTATGAIAQMYVRKQNLFTEKKIYPYVIIGDLRTDMLPRLRILADNNSGNQKHPWTEMTDEEMLKSAGLFATDRVTGETGYNLAAVVLLGRDDVIRDILPAYLTDALLRRENVDRYDDRETVTTNLIDSYDQLLAFGRKHLPDPFFLEGEQRRSLRGILLREMISNLLIHREFTSTYQAKFVIERDRMFTQNANRAAFEGYITPDNMEPTPKNPIIASFFRHIGYADRLGSGVRNLFGYSKYYSGKDPIMQEKDIFTIIVPLKETGKNGTDGTNDTLNVVAGVGENHEDVNATYKKLPIGVEKLTDSGETAKKPEENLPVKISWQMIAGLCQEQGYSEPTVLNLHKVYDQINANQVFGTAHILKILECSERTARNLISKMKEMDVLVSVTGKGKGMYRLKLEDRRSE